MRTYQRTTTIVGVLTLGALACSGLARGEGVTDWRTYKAGSAITMTGQGTNDPVFGDLTTSANQSFAIGYLTTPATLGPNAGDKITFSFGVAFNDNTGMVNAGDNFRFALFDLNGEAKDSISGGNGGTEHYATAGTANTDNYRGYWIGVRNGSGTGSTGSIRERTQMMTGSQNVFTNNATDPATSLGIIGGTAVTLTSDIMGDGTGADYLGTLILARNATGMVDVSGSFIGSNGVTGNEIMVSDTTANTGSTYGSVAFLFGNALNNDQFTFTDIDVTVGGAQPIPGDFNNDTKVDDADFTVWRTEFGTTLDGEDFLVWQQNYGTGVPQAIASVAGLPEPAAATLAGAALIGTLARGRRRRSAK